MFNPENFNLTEKIYTGTACGACDKYGVCVSLRIPILTSIPPADKMILADDTMMVATKKNTGAIIIQELVHMILFWGVCTL